MLQEANGREAVQIDKEDTPCLEPFSISAAVCWPFLCQQGTFRRQLILGRWLQNPNCLLEKYGIPAAEAHPARRSFAFGNGRFGQVHFAANVPVGIAAC